MTVPGAGGVLHAVAAEWHVIASYVFAVFFPVLRYAKCRMAGRNLSFETAVHQAGTGFVLPAFLILIFAYKEASLVSLLSAHEMGIAGIMALIASGRELFISGVEKEDRSSSRFN